MPFAGMSEAGGKKSKLDDVSDDDDRAVPEELFNVVVAGDESPQSAGKKWVLWLRPIALLSHESL